MAPPTTAIMIHSVIPPRISPRSTLAQFRQEYGAL